MAKGECEACPRTDVELYASVSENGTKMLLCDKCHGANQKAMDGSKWINNALKQAQMIDSKVELKQDIFNAATVPFVELKAAIQNDASIPANMKNEVFVQRCEARIKHLSEVIFAEEQATNIKRNERYSWSQQTRQFISGLQEAEREKFKKYNVAYTPKTLTKHQRGPAKTRTRTKSFDKNACMAASKKYNVPMSGVQMMVKSKPGMSYEEAAKHLANIMGVTVSK